MRKFKIDLKLLPSLLGWLFFILFLSFFLSMLLTSSPAHAEGLDCVHHKNFLGLRDGWDCKAPASTATLTLPTGTALLQLDQDALATLGKPHRFEFAAQCVTPGSNEADCKFDSSGKDSK